MFTNLYKCIAYLEPIKAVKKSPPNWEDLKLFK